MLSLSGEVHHLLLGRDGALGLGTITRPAEILTVSTPTAPEEDWHRFGSLGFEPDGETLWVLLGDHFVRDRAQDTATPFGSLLRIVLQPPGAATA